MAFSFSELRKNRQADLAKVNQEVAKLSTNQTSSDDDRFWSPTVDKAGNGYAVIRFLAPPVGEDVPFVRRWDHGFKGPGGWYIELNLNTIGKEDPVSEMNQKLWQQGENSQGRKIVSGSGKDQPGSKRRMHYIANILVVDDPGNPENNGKVKLYKFGKKIFDKLNDVMNPKFPDEKPLNPFDLWEGANFRLKIRQVEGYRNYDKSDFDKNGDNYITAPVAESDEDIEAIWKQEHSLQAFVNPTDTKLFKPYEELKRKLNKVMGLDGAPASTQPAQEAPAAKAAEAPRAPETFAQQAPSADLADDAGDEGLDFFRKLASAGK